MHGGFLFVSPLLLPGLRTTHQKQAESCGRVPRHGRALWKPQGRFHSAIGEAPGASTPVRLPKRVTVFPPMKT
ncbi:hypothetical protein B0H63DRAFT_467461 [Podospora didyma]|uniref:Secreted protein n=1 Tax=Podospora didyma TaxID=330526 RepID=A0AAE0P0V6_9PEZI|nr:hypothetical protein B0H63DRAFT_467461 [Podospora didyma]